MAGKLRHPLLNKTFFMKSPRIIPTRCLHTFIEKHNNPIRKDFLGLIENNPDRVHAIYPALRISTSFAINLPNKRKLVFTVENKSIHLVPWLENQKSDKRIVFFKDIAIDCCQLHGELKEKNDELEQKVYELDDENEALAMKKEELKKDRDAYVKQFNCSSALLDKDREKNKTLEKKTEKLQKEKEKKYSDLEKQNLRLSLQLAELIHEKEMAVKDDKIKKLAEKNEVLEKKAADLEKALKEAEQHRQEVDKETNA